MIIYIPTILNKYTVITPCSTVYENVTAMYMCMVENSHIHMLSISYYQESEYGSMVVLYISTILYKYTVIADRDPILHEYYITGAYKRMIYKV